MKTINRYVQENNSSYQSSSVANRIALRGTESLSDAELISVFIQPKSKDIDPIDVATQLLTEVKCLDTLVNLEVDDFTKFTGLGKASFIKFKAAIELDRRRLFNHCAETDVFSSPSSVREFLARQLSGVEDEVFSMLLLDNRHRLIEYREIGIGTIDSAAIYPRSVVKHCLEVNCAATVFAHNHPSGVAEPSDTDVRLTRKLTDALALIDVRVLDHLIVGKGVQTSLAERGLM